MRTDGCGVAREMIAPSYILFGARPDEGIVKIKDDSRWCCHGQACPSRHYAAICVTLRERHRMR
jgi:hypothetical protein